MKLNLLRYAMTVITLLCACTFTATAQTNVSPAEARSIAKEAFIYGYPLVDSYRVEYAYFVDHKSPEFKAPWNQITNIPRVFTPKDVQFKRRTRTRRTRGSGSTCARNRSCSPCLPWIAKTDTSASNLQTPTPSTSTTWAPAPPETMAAPSWSPDRIGREIRRKESSGSFTPKLNSSLSSIAPRFSIAPILRTLRKFNPAIKSRHCPAYLRHSRAARRAADSFPQADQRARAEDFA